MAASFEPPSRTTIGAPPRRRRYGVVLSALLLPLLLLLGACSGDEGESTAAAELSPEAREGLRLVQESGCVACHGEDGTGGVAPSWKGLAGSLRLLTDGREVIADREYLVRAIMDPSAEIVDGSTLVMPENHLSREEVDRIVDYLEEFS